LLTLLNLSGMDGIKYFVSLATLLRRELMQMIPVPYSVMNGYVAILASREIPPSYIEYYKKWLRYFYDFSANYLEMNDKPEKVKLFLEKLRSRKQTPAQCQQAAHAISLYFEMQSLEMQQIKSVAEPDKEKNLLLEHLSSPADFSFVCGTSIST